MEKLFSALTDLKTWFASEIAKISGAQSELTTAKQSLSEANTALTAAQSTIADLNAKLKTASESATKNTEEIAALKVKLTEAENKATEAIAAQGLNPSRLPQPSLSDAGSKTIQQQVEALRNQLSASTDPKEKFKLSNQIKELLSKKN